MRRRRRRRGPPQPLVEVARAATAEARRNIKAGWRGCAAVPWGGFIQHPFPQTPPHKPPVKKSPFPSQPRRMVIWYGPQTVRRSLLVKERTISPPKAAITFTTATLLLIACR